MSDPLNFFTLFSPAGQRYGARTGAARQYPQTFASSAVRRNRFRKRGAARQVIVILY